MRGRVQATKKVKQLMGYKNINDIDLKPLRSIRCPSWLPEHSKKLWSKLAPKLTALGLLSELDKSTFEALCLSYGLMRKAAEEMINDGLSIKAERGETLKKHPSFTTYKTCADLFRRFVELFGLSPLARQRLDIELPDDPSEWDELEKLLDRPLTLKSRKKDDL